MKAVALYGKTVNREHIEQIEFLIDTLLEWDVKIFICAPFHDAIKDHFSTGNIDVFSNSKDILNELDVFMSIGGDGTFLESARQVAGSSVPIIGFNTGRLGFLSRISSSDLKEALVQLKNRDYGIEQRAMLQLKTEGDLFGSDNFALNEFTVHKNDTSSMIIVKTWLNDEYLNTYWADGLIIATPTGSTAYSMSCGGPIIMPGSENFIITPVAPHNLNVRPIVIPDNSQIRLSIEGRINNYMVSLDSRIHKIDHNTDLYISLFPKKLNLITLKNHTYLTTLRNKLNWGLDKRN